MSEFVGFLYTVVSMFRLLRVSWYIHELFTYTLLRFIGELNCVMKVVGFGECCLYFSKINGRDNVIKISCPDSM